MSVSGIDANRLARYVPRAASEWEYDAPDSMWQEVDSTLCFVDLSGFTKLSERLARRGRIGAEELTEVLNRVFSEMLELAFERGGALLKFGGDALLLHFSRPTHALDAACAAVEMRAALRQAAEIKTSVGRLALQMSVGIHSGLVHLFKVGTSHRELVVAGPAATQVAAMESAANAGEILISPQTAQLLPRGAVGVAQGPGFLLKWRTVGIPRQRAVDRRKVAAEALAECLPVVLRSHLAAGPTEPEHRVATVGFVKFKGVDALLSSSGPEGVAAALHEIVSVTQGAVDDAGVTLLATDLDQNGGKLILVTGVPTAQEDDDGRMLRAVRRIIDAGTQLSVQVGVNRGHVFTGAVGSPYRATFTVMGDTVNLAARLMAAAPPGHLYCSPEVLDRSRTLFVSEPLEPFYVKGKANAVQAYSVGAEIGPRRSTTSHELDFVGRQTEIDLIVEAIDAAGPGTGGVVTVVGPSGVGKSRLVDVAIDRAGRTSFEVHAELAGSTSPYRACRDPFRELLGVTRADPVSMAAQLGAAVAERLPELLPMLPLLGDVMHIHVPSTPRVDSIEPRFRPDRTADAVIQLLEACSPGPLVFLFDDAQWFDSASSSLIERIVAATENHPWTVIVVRRPERGGIDPTTGVRIELPPLGADDAYSLVLAATAAAPLRSHEVELIVQRSEGSPLFLGELLRMARLGRVEDLPDSLDAVVHAEIDALGALARRLVGYASVLGRTFRLEVLRELLADDPIDLDDATTRQLGRFLEYDGTEAARFRHALHRDVAYEGLSYRRRRELHLRAGQITERLAGDAPESAADALSRHYSLGHEPGLAWQYARIASDRARAQYANLEAVAHLERAIDAARRLDRASSDELVDVWRTLGDVREQLGLFDDAIEAYRTAASYVGGDPVTRSDLLLRRARVRMHLGAYRTALAEATRGHRLLEGVEGEGAMAVRARLTALKALLRQAQQRAEPAHSLARQAIDEAEAAADDAALARAYLVSDWANRVLGISEAAAFGELALAIYERNGDLDGAGKASNNLGGIAYFNGHWGEAERWYRKALDAYRRCGNEASAAVAGGNLAELLISQRAFGEADQMLRDSIRVLRSVRALDDVLFAEIQLGRLMSERGAPEAAIDHLARLRAEALAVGQVGYAFEAALHLASAQIALDRHDDAIATIDAASAGVGPIDVVYQPWLALVRARATIGNGRTTEARAMIESGLAIAREQSLVYDEASLLEVAIALDERGGVDPDPKAIERLAEIKQGLDTRLSDTR